MAVFGWVSAKRRGIIYETLNVFRILEEKKYLRFLKKYPSPEIGHPLLFNRKGYRFTYRYLRHIYLLGLFSEHLQDKLSSGSILMDIGSSYGIFSSLIKQEMPKSHHVLVDLPGQLVLAHYYLSQLFPNAKIAGFKEVNEASRIDRNFILEYDFVLIPTSMYGKLEARSADVVTNFVSLIEMSRDWFFTYINSEVFKMASYFFTVNRYDSYPTYHNQLTFLDFPFDRYEPIFVRTFPVQRFYYKPFLFFWCKKVEYPSQLFQFIGKSR